jgi:hypothetical protein
MVTVDIDTNVVSSVVFILLPLGIQETLGSFSSVITANRTSCFHSYENASQQNSYHTNIHFLLESLSIRTVANEVKR